MLTRRSFLQNGMITGAALGAGILTPQLLLAQANKSDVYETVAGPLSVHPVSHASLVLNTPGAVIYVDPVGGAEKYASLPPADLIMITHEHGDHLNVDTLAALLGDETQLVTNPAVLAQLPAEYKERAQAIGNGDSTTVGDISIDAIGAYNLTEDRLKYHPKGRDNGYVMGINSKRVYIAGDTEAVPEMRALQAIDIAFVPMNNPYTMEVDQAADGVLEFAPKVVYPYHHKGSDIDVFEELVNKGGKDIKVLQRSWYG